jgi:hypothetical protein
MLREEAEREAERRNREDADRERFEFYPFDESAGIAPDAWDVAARLRQGPRTDRPATAAALAHAHEDAPPYLPEPAVYEEVVYEEPVVYADEPVYAEPEPLPAQEAQDDRPGFFVRTVGAVVIVSGLLWMAMVVALAVFLKPDDATTFAVYIGAAVLGLLAIGLGVAIRRS